MDLKLIRILSEAPTKVVGTNCANCRFASSKHVDVESGEENKQGGLSAPDKKHLALAEKGDLITLPGNGSTGKKMMCTHTKIDQYVNERMCCAYWDADGVLREWKQ